MYDFLLFLISNSKLTRTVRSTNCSWCRWTNITMLMNKNGRSLNVLTSFVWKRSRYCKYSGTCTTEKTWVHSTTVTAVITSNLLVIKETSLDQWDVFPGSCLEENKRLKQQQHGRCWWCKWTSHMHQFFWKRSLCWPSWSLQLKWHLLVT